jgi:hypothetical protein
MARSFSEAALSMKTGDFLSNYLNPLAFCLRAGILMTTLGLMLAAFLPQGIAFLLRVFCFDLAVWLAWIGVKPWRRVISLRDLVRLRDEMARRQRQQ